MHIAGESSFVMKNGRRKCVCDICACSYCVIFPRNWRYEEALASRTEKRKMNVIDVDSPSNTVPVLCSVSMSGVQNWLAIAR